LFSLFRSFTPRVEGLSLDEAFLDVSGLRRHFDSPVAVADAIRSTIRSQLSLPASVGIASSKFMAKLASEAAKPDGIKHIPLGEQLAFLHGLPVGALWGVGPATLAGLARLGVSTIGDLAQLSENTIAQSFGPAAGRQLSELAKGIDSREVVPDGGAKSLSVEETFPSDLIGRDGLEATLLGQSQRLSGRLRRAGLAAATIGIKVRYEDFTTITRSVTRKTPMDAPRDLFALGRRLLDDVDVSRPIRLLGLGASSLTNRESPHQLALDSDEQWDRLADTVTEIHGRFGDRSLKPARLLDMIEEDSESDQ
jgi:DNA polymerase-4